MEIDCERHRILLGLIQQIPELTEELQPFLQTEKWSRDKRHLLINFLVQQLLHTVKFSTKITNQIFLVLLAQILQDYPSLHTITGNHLLSIDTYLIKWKEENPKKKLKIKANKINDDVYLHLATWKWNILIHLLENIDDENVKWLAFLCLSIVFNMSYNQQDLYRPNVSNTTIFKIYDSINPNPTLSIVPSSIPLSKYNSNKQQNDDELITEIKLTHTSTIDKCLRVITLAWTTLISSPISNGKTMIVEYIAEQVGKRLIKIQSSDHMDRKVLLGTYQCTNKPGEFFWTPGLLIEATSEDH